MTLTPQDEEALLRVLQRYRDLERETGRIEAEARAEARRATVEKERRWLGEQLLKRNWFARHWFYLRALSAAYEGAAAFRKFMEKHR